MKFFKFGHVFVLLALVLSDLSLSNGSFKDEHHNHSKIKRLGITIAMEDIFSVLGRDDSNNLYLNDMKLLNSHLVRTIPFPNRALNQNPVAH